MKKLLRFLLVLGVLAGLAAAASRIRERLAVPLPLGSPAGPTPAPAPADDLAVVKGIGPVNSARLAEAGIATFRALAGAPLDAVVAATGVPPGRAADWIAQAAALAAR